MCGETYRLRKRSSTPLPGNKDNHIARLLHILDVLTSRNITPRRGIQQRRQEHGCSWYQLRRHLRALQNVVFEDIDDGVLVVVCKCGVELRVGDLVKGIVVWCEDLPTINPNPLPKKMLKCREAIECWK